MHWTFDAGIDGKRNRRRHARGASGYHITSGSPPPYKSLEEEVEGRSRGPTRLKYRLVLSRLLDPIRKIPSLSCPVHDATTRGVDAQALVTGQWECCARKVTSVGGAP